MTVFDEKVVQLCNYVLNSSSSSPEEREAAHWLLKETQLANACGGEFITHIHHMKKAEGAQ